MLARIRKAMDENESGFTLIELLVVMIIIGILAAIAIPVFLNQRKNAVDASMKSDLRTIANELESVYTDTEAYPAVASFVGTGAALPTVTITTGVTTRVSKGNSFTYTLNGATDAFCVAAANTKGTHGWAYKSNAGGLQPSAVTDCTGF
jgi:prepilin-type N-terminal cleavage/methylation domain-containing protein